MVAPGVDVGKVARVQTALLEWYARHARDLPWRHTRDPYAVLVAEVMLQQTQVERVIPKWHAWLARFPGFVELAEASRADAVRAWQGLGYNLRAVRLHAIAQQVVWAYGGCLPDSPAGLMQLKGIGRYTAGAVACFAFEQPVAMVDTNVRRVLGRVFATEDSDGLAVSVVPRTAAYAWNQALMDLGATVCTARRPLCLVCPLLAECGVAGGSSLGEARGARQRLDGGAGTALDRLARASDRAKGSLATAKERARIAAEGRMRRGRVIDALRALPPGAWIELPELATRLDPPEPERRLARVVERLATDGLVTREGNRVRLAD